MSRRAAELQERNNEQFNKFFTKMHETVNKENKRKLFDERGSMKKVLIHQRDVKRTGDMFEKMNTSIVAEI